MRINEHSRNQPPENQLHDIQMILNKPGLYLKNPIQVVQDLGQLALLLLFHKGSKFTLSFSLQES